MRINVIGTSGSGKTSFGRTLADVLCVPFIEMDALFWGPNWSMPEDDELFARLAEALSGDAWVLDGNYTRTLALKMDRVQAVVWLNYSFPRTVIQALKRAAARLISQEELWPDTGNRENLEMLFSKDSIVLWTITSYFRHKKRNLGYIIDQNYQHIRFHRIRSPGESRDFLELVRGDPQYILTNDFGIVR